MEYEIDGLACEVWGEADDEPRCANHAPRWTLDCMQKQTGIAIPEETIQVDHGLLPAE